MQFTSILALSATLLGAVHGSSIPQHEVREVNVSPREIHAFWKGDVAWYGEKVSFLFLPLPHFMFPSHHPWW